MMAGLPNARFLPVTIGLIAGLLGVKAVVLTETALAGETGAAAGPAAAAFVDKTPTAARSPLVRHPTIRVDTMHRPDRGKAGADAALVTSLEKEKADLDHRTSELDAREAAFRAASEALDRRMTSLEALDHKLSNALETRKAQDDTAWLGLVKVYEAMRPDDAATIFNGLEIHTLLQLLGRMNERKAALVLGAMQPERARIATQMLAEQRLQEPGVPAAPAPAD